MDKPVTLPSTKIASAEMVPPAANPSFVPDKLNLDYDGVKRAAAKLGMVSFDEQSLAASHLLGTEMKKVGAIKIGRTILLRAADHAQEGIRQADVLIDTSTDEELKAHVLGAKASMIKAQVECGEKFIRSAEVDASDDADSKPSGFKPFEPRHPVVIANQAVVNTAQ